MVLDVNWSRIQLFVKKGSPITNSILRLKESTQVKHILCPTNATECEKRHPQRQTVESGGK